MLGRPGVSSFYTAVISTNQFKNGTHIEIDGKIFKILEFQHVKPGKGGAFVRTKLREIEDGSVQDKTFRAGEKFRPVRTESQQDAVPLRLRRRGGLHGQPDYEQIEIPHRARSATRCSGCCPNAEVDVLFVDERPSDVQVPSAVDMKVTETEPGVKGDTASGGGTKPATLESGVTSRCRSSSRRARRSGSTPAAASTSRAPDRGGPIRPPDLAETEELLHIR